MKSDSTTIVAIIGTPRKLSKILAAANRLMPMWMSSAPRRPMIARNVRASGQYRRSMNSGSVRTPERM